MKINQRVLILREAITKLVPMLAQKHVDVTFRGARAFVEWDKRTFRAMRVNLPYLPDDASDELIGAVQGYLDHEVAHILETDVRSVEAADAQGPSMAYVHNVIEDTFIERQMGKRFPGSEYNLENLGHFLVDKKLRPAYDAMKASTDPKEHLSNLMVCAFRALAGQPVFIDYMDEGDKWKMLEPWLDQLGPDLIQRLPKIQTSAECLEVAEEVYRRMGLKKPPPPPPTPPAPPPPAPPEKQEPDDGDDEQDEPQDGASSEPSEPSDPSDQGEQEPTEKQDAPEEKEAPADAPSTPNEQPEPQEEEDTSDSDGEPEESDETGDDTDGGEGESGEGKEGQDDAGTAPSTEQEQPGDEAPQESDQAGKGEATDDAADDDAEPEKGVSAEAQDSGDEADESGGEADTGASGPEIPQPEVDDSRDETIEDAADQGNFDDMVAGAISGAAADAGRHSEYLVFTTDDDELKPIEPDAKAYNNLATMQEEVDSMLLPMQKDIERMIAARSAAVWTGGHKRGRLHGPALIRAHLGKVDVFRRKQENKTLNVAVALQVDCSYSMVRNDKLKTACYSAYALASILERIGIPVSVTGFTTKEYSRQVKKDFAADPMRELYVRQEAILMPIFKTFSERMTTDVKARFTHAFNDYEDMCGANVDGESLLLTARTLVARTEARKIIMVLSDGLPSTHGGTKRCETHLKKVVHMIEESGTDIVGIGICDSSVHKFYPKAVVIQSVDDLPATVMGQLKALLMK